LTTEWFINLCSPVQYENSRSYHRRFANPLAPFLGKIQESIFERNVAR
jgi:hypothetical protein